MPEKARKAGSRSRMSSLVFAISSGPRIWAMAWGARRSFMYEGVISNGTNVGSLGFDQYLR